MAEDKKDFKIKDKRFFSEDKESGQQKTAEGEKPLEGEDKSSGKGREQTGANAAQSATLPEVNFATFIFSLNSETLFHLGIIGSPTTGKREKNLVLAKHTIDTLAMLEKKTKGNLTDDEAAMLKNILYDLRIIYVRETG